MLARASILVRWMPAAVLLLAFAAPAARAAIPSPSPILAESLTQRIGEAMRDMYRQADLETARKFYSDYITTDHIRIALIVVGALGLLLCFVGYHIWRWLLAIIGMSLGLVLGGAGGFVLADHLGKDVDTCAVFAIGGAVAGFVIFPLLMSIIVPLGTFVLATLVVGGITYAVCIDRGIEMQNAAIAAGVGGGVLGLVLAILGRPGRIFFSSILGAPMLTIAGLALAEIRGFAPGKLADMAFNRDCSAIDAIVIGLMAGVAVLGMAFQFLTSSSPRKRQQQQQQPLDVPQPSLDEQLNRLRALRQRNLITEEDYQRKRNALLAQTQYAAQSQMGQRRPPQSPQSPPLPPPAAPPGPRRP